MKKDWPQSAGSWHPNLCRRVAARGGASQR
jgi:hypothetical protein